MCDPSDSDRDRHTRLRDITDRLAEGDYRVEALDVADAILRDWRMDDLIDALAATVPMEGEAAPDQSNEGSGSSCSSD